MTIRYKLAAAAVVFSMAFVFAPSASAKSNEEQKTTQPTPVIVTVNQGDSLTSIADANKTTFVRLFDANESIKDPNIINAGDKIRVPQADEQLPDRYSGFAASQAVAVATAATPNAQPVYSQTYTPGAQAVYGTDSKGNTYFKGYCTWYVKDKRPDLPNQLGNGGQWTANAAAKGYATGTTPKAGAVVEMPGHVAYVESVNANGTIVISEMNGPAGFGVVGTRTVPSNQYRYIY